MASLFLDLWLAPLLPALARADVTDIYINRPGEFWTEVLGGQTHRHACPELDGDRLWQLARQIAAHAGQALSRARPLLGASLPGGARVQVVAPPATRGFVVIAIRKHGAAQRTLADWSAQGAFAQAKISHGLAAMPSPALPDQAEVEDGAAFLARMVRARRNILVSGGTSSGKTTFLNALLREIPARERLVTIEDTPELAIRHANAVGLLARREADGEGADFEQLLQASLRLRPDRIILGELRGGEAYSFLRAVNTGHPGSLATIHADSPEGAMEQLALIMLRRGGGLSRRDILDYARRVIDVVVQLERVDGARRVSRIMLTRAEERGSC